MFVFVYGSLKKGFKYHYIIEEEKNSNYFYLGEAKTVEKFSLHRYEKSDFPYLSKDKKDIIKGELYKVKDLKNLDHFEGYPDFYTRELIEVESEGIKYNAYVYLMKEKPKEKTKNLKEWTLEDQNENNVYI